MFGRAVTAGIGILILSCALALIPVASVWPDSENVMLVGMEPFFGEVNDVCVVDGYAYVCAEGALVILDVREPSNPARLGVIDIRGHEVHVSGGYAYIVRSGDDLRIVDVSDPEMPREVGVYTTPVSGRLVGIDAFDDYVCIADEHSGLRILDISDPTNPREVGFCSLQRASSVHISGHYAYIAAFDHGLHIVDISDPSNPEELSFCDTQGDAWDVHVSGSHAYVAEGRRGLEVFDVSDPEKPVAAGLCCNAGNSYVFGVKASGNYAYIAHEDIGLVVVDVSDPASPERIGAASLMGRAVGVDVSGSYAYVASKRGGFWVIDISDPGVPKKKRQYDATPELALGVHVSGDYAYVACNNGLLTVDVSDPLGPKKKDFQYYQGGSDVHVSDGYAYVAGGGKAGLRILDVSDPMNPQRVGYCDTGSALGVHVIGNYAYVAGSGGGLRVIDVSDPTDPKEVGSSSGMASGVRVSNGYAYIADGREGLRVIDVSDPANPQEVGLYNTPDGANGVYATGGYAYITDRQGGLWVIDVSDPSEPKEVGVWDSNLVILEKVYVSDNYAYVSAWHDGLRVVDVSDPKSPTEVGFYDGDSGAYDGICVSDGYVYVAGWSGLYILWYEGSDVDTGPAMISIAAEQSVAREHDLPVTVNIDNVTELAGFQFDIVFDSTVLEATQVEEGAFLSDSGSTYWLESNIDNTSGAITGIGCAKTGKGAVDGSGALATITFKAIGAGESHIRLQNITLSDSNGEVISAMVIDASVTVAEFPSWDVNKDGIVNIVDIVLVGQTLGESITTPSEPNPDVNDDGLVNIQDVVLVGQHFGETYLPAAPPEDLWTVDPQYLPILAIIYDIMERKPGSAPNFLATKELIYRLIQDVRISKTEMLQNYPNPFNPETWIPYQLAQDSQVTITIYSATGQLVKTMDLGIKKAGAYVTRDAAAHWDGRCDSGGFVASGIYYYSIQAGEYMVTKKMIVAR